MPNIILAVHKKLQPPVSVLSNRRSAVRTTIVWTVQVAPTIPGDVSRVGLDRRVDPVVLAGFDKDLHSPVAIESDADIAFGDLVAQPINWCAQGHPTGPQAVISELPVVPHRPIEDRKDFQAAVLVSADAHAALQ